jgi:hypothetical protein
MQIRKMAVVMVSMFLGAVLALGIRDVVASPRGFHGYSGWLLSTTMEFKRATDFTLQLQAESPTADALILDIRTGVGAGTTRFSVDEDGDIVGANLNLSNGITVSAGTVDFPANSIPGDDIADGTIDSSEIQDNQLDYIDLQNTLDLDATTEVNLGAYNYSIDLSAAGDFQILDAGVAHHIFYDSGDVRLGNNNEVYVDTDVNRVGIGVASPSATLDVAGAAEINGTLNMVDSQVQNVRAIQGKDWDDDTGGADNKYRLLYRDGAHMFYNGGVVVGGYANATWADLTDGYLIVKSHHRPADRRSAARCHPGGN